MDNRDWNPVRQGDIYCSSACGGKCTWTAYQEAIRSSNELAKRCQEEIGGIWNTRIHENLGWHWSVVLKDANISIHWGGYLSENGDYFTVGFYGGTPSQLYTNQIFATPKEAYNTQLALIKNEASNYNELLRANTV